MDKRVLVTGAAGYIGSVLVGELIQKGYAVTALDAHFMGSDSLKKLRDRIETMIQADIRDVTPDLIKGQDAVVDLAAFPNDASAELNPELTKSVNYMARTRIAKLAKEVGGLRYIAPSSAGNYGWQKEWCTEETQLNPLTTYTKANAAWEEDILPLADKDFTVTVLRQSTVYGVSPCQRWDIIVPDFVRKVALQRKIVLSGDGEEYRPFIHILDDCQAIIKVLEAPEEKVNGQVFNVGSNAQSIKIREVIKELRAALPVPFDVEYGALHYDLRDYRMDCTKISRVLGFAPEYTIADGAKHIWKAIESGELNPKDPRGERVKWYKGLIEKGSLK